MSKLSFDMGGLENGLSKLENKADAAIRMYAETGSKKLEGYAKENRKWTDRTGHARQRLTGSVATISQGYRIYLAHGVDYGIWLELAHEKKFSIIPEAIEQVGTLQIMPGLKKLLERLG